ncbi:MerR family transcriptional regulator [Actinosynnema sp. ALI-1.44]|uniref:transcriptional regulator FtsR n=1 Tax=Actinosynnema sp. ALI-1.44 TaxID=1933779 RepID=UPI00097BE5C6|nr:MerR family transcriptional regulator [Actinosynnema sp. ALI-1.44]ONI87498.1 MerR family transcriptional regulator [Actinosynnema sp. ALI-1.44]
MSIGTVLGQLRAEFPDVTVSKIRFLESEGLVLPGRTPSGYRQFTAADVERLRYVLRAQRDQYLPLKVIKQQLAAADRGESPGPRGVSGHRPQPADDGPRSLTRDELLAATGLTPATLTELEEFGLVKPGDDGTYDPVDAELGMVVRAMARFGIEPRHLRAYRAAADREVGLLEQIVTPLYRQRDTRARDRADQALRELASLSVALHTLLVKMGLRRVTGG